MSALSNSWRSAIHRSYNTVLLLMKDSKPLPSPEGGPSLYRVIPHINMPSNLLPPAVRELATLALGIGFDTDRPVRMTALQYSVVCYSLALATGSAGENFSIFHTLLKATRKEDLNYECFGNRSNVVHLAAFLDLHNVIKLLMLHGADATLINGQGLSPCDIIDAVKAANTAVPSTSTCEESSETGSIILETKILDYFGFQGDEDQGSSEEDIEDDNLTAVDRSWDSSEYTLKPDPETDEHNSTATKYTSPQLYHLSFDDDKAARSCTYRETSSVPSLDNLYLNLSTTKTQSRDNLDHEHFESVNPESCFEESSDEEDLYSTSLLYQIHQLRSPEWDRPPPVHSAMRHDRRFGLQSATYFDYISTLNLIARSPERSDSVRKTVHWEEVKDIIVFRRHLHESDEPESDEEAEEDEIATFRRTQVYQEYGLDPVYSLNMFESSYDAKCRMTPFEASSTNVDEDEVGDSPFDSVSSSNNFYGLSQTNASTHDLQTHGASSVKTSVIDRPLPRVPVGQESQTNTLLPASKCRDPLQRQAPSPPKLTLNTQEQIPANPAMTWQPQSESGITFSAKHDPRLSIALKSPPPQSLPRVLLANAPPMLAELLKKFPDGSPSSPTARARADSTSTTPHQVHRLDYKKEPLAPPSSRPSLCRSRSETSLVQHLSDDIPLSSSSFDLGCFEKELPGRPKTWSKGAKVMSTLKTSLKFLSPPPSPSLSAFSSSSPLTAPWLPRQCKRSVRPMSLVLPRPLDSTPALSQVLDKMTPSSEDVEAMSSHLGVDSNMTRCVPKVTSSLVNTAFTRNAIDLLPPCVNSRILCSDSDRTRSPQVYPHQQSEEPTTTVRSIIDASAQERTSFDQIVDHRSGLKQSDINDYRLDANSEWSDRSCKVEAPHHPHLQLISKDLQVSRPTTTASYVSAAVSRPEASSTVHDTFSHSIIRKKSLTRATSKTCELSLHHLHDYDSSDGMELIHGVLHNAIDESEDMVLMGSALINLQGVAQGLPIQRYTARRSKNVQLFSDRAEQCTLDVESQALKPRFNVWTFRSTMPMNHRNTLSSCGSPSSTETGVLFLRIKSFADFALPVPTEGTMVSIRIDTGLEKVDTDYFPLEDIEILFNQEFCIPVTPDLVLTLTLHLMQSPKLHPRSQSPYLATSISDLVNLADSHVQKNTDLRTRRSLDGRVTGSLRSPNSSLTWRATAATISSRTSRSLASIFQKQYAQSNRSSGCSSDDSGTTTAFAGVGSVYPSATDETTPTSSRHAVPRQSMVSLASATKSTIAKWKRNILTSSALRKRSGNLSTSSESESLPDQDNSPTIRYPGRRAHLDAPPADLPVLVQHSDSVIDSSPYPSLPQLSMEEIHGSDTPFQILSRHTLFEDENCIARSGIVFEDLRTACENQIVQVEFLSINNWMDRGDYSCKGSQIPKRSQKPKSRGIDGDSDSETQSEDLAESTETEFVVGKILSSLCFLPGQVMDHEDALFDDENRSPTEPQNMLECQQGLLYFQWQNQITYQGSLFYMTESNVWVEGLFRIVGSRLWRYHYRSDRGMQDHDDESLEMIAYLDLESVTSIETNLGVFVTRPSLLEKQDSGRVNALPGDMNVVEGQVPFYAVNNSFRVHMTPVGALGDNSAISKTSPRLQDFYAKTPESGQEWVTALMTNCQSRPPTPYWLNSKGSS